MSVRTLLPRTAIIPLMPPDYFKVQNMTSLSELSPDASIHFIGVCGVAMGQLAASLAESGYTVSGSDKEFYEPMGSFLENSLVRLLRGYSASNVPEGVDLVVIGNSISYGHEEGEVIEQKQLPDTCFPKLLHETVIRGKTSVVVCGTHGKTTTTSMIASSLCKLGLDPSYFVGGVTADLPTSLHAGAGKISVVEGDEYDDVFFSKRPKFSYYIPDVLVLTSAEFDHADL